MNSFLFKDETDIQLIREFIKRLPESTIVDFEEAILLSTFKSTACLWQADHRIIGFAFLDDSNNLWFETAPDYIFENLIEEIVDYGVQCMRKRNSAIGRTDTLDHSCSGGNLQRIAMLEKYGFVRQTVRTLRYARSLEEPIAANPLPPGFSIRPVEGKPEIESLVALHRAAFGTDNMTVERRSAIMHAPQYNPELDLVAVASNGDRCAFCICGIDAENEHVGYTDPIGVHPRYQKLGLGKAVVTAGMQALMMKGVTRVELGTSSENTAMQRLAEKLGFGIVSERLWFSKSVA